MASSSNLLLLLLLPLLLPSLPILAQHTLALQNKRPSHIDFLLADTLTQQRHLVRLPPDSQHIIQTHQPPFAVLILVPQPKDLFIVVHDSLLPPVGDTTAVKLEWSTVSIKSGRRFVPAFNWSDVSDHVWPSKLLLKVAKSHALPLLENWENLPFQGEVPSSMLFRNPFLQREEKQQQGQDTSNSHQQVQTINPGQDQQLQNMQFYQQDLGNLFSQQQQAHSFNQEGFQRVQQQYSVNHEQHGTHFFHNAHMEHFSQPHLYPSSQQFHADLQQPQGQFQQTSNFNNLQMGLHPQSQGTLYPSTEQLHADLQNHQLQWEAYLRYLQQHQEHQQQDEP